MEVKINIEKDDEFNAIIKDGLKALTDEDKRELIKEVFKKSIVDSNDIKSLFIEQNHYNYTLRPTELTRNIIQSMDFSKEFEQFKARITDELMNNTTGILKELFIENIFSQFSRDYHRNSELAMIVIDEMRRRNEGN